MRSSQLRHRHGHARDLPGNVGLPAPKGLGEMGENGPALVAAEALRHHVQYVVYDAGAKLEVKVTLHALVGDVLGKAVGVRSCCLVARCAWRGLIYSYAPHKDTRLPRHCPPVDCCSCLCRRRICLLVAAQSCTVLLCSSFEPRQALLRNRPLSCKIAFSCCPLGEN